MPDAKVNVGCAGWSIFARHSQHFPTDGSHLERYAARFAAVEINTSFYRPHRPATYARWAASVPDDFRFAVKVPKTITHEHRLVGVETELERFLAEIASLGRKLGPILVQLPPSLAFDAQSAASFFSSLRERFHGQVVCEPRHATWFSSEAGALLAGFRVAGVAADPAPALRAGEPGGWDGLVYYRLHGSPRIYYSAYNPLQLQQLAARLAAYAAEGIEAWCIFDNTAEGAATTDALSLLHLLSEP